MTKDQFTLMAEALIRHLLTVAAGFLVARGYAGIGGAVGNYAAGAAVFGAVLAWSFIQKHKLLEELCAGANLSQIEQLLAQASQFKANGADPLLVAHMIGTALSIAQQEAVAVHPELAPVIAAASPPAPQTTVDFQADPNAVAAAAATLAPAPVSAPLSAQDTQEPVA